MTEKEFEKIINTEIASLFKPIYDKQVELTKVVTKAVEDSFFKGMDIGKKLKSN